MAVELAGDGNLGGEMHGDAKVVVGSRFAEQLQIVHPSILFEHSKVCGDIVGAIDMLIMRELVGFIFLQPLTL